MYTHIHIYACVYIHTHTKSTRSAEASMASTHTTTHICTHIIHIRMFIQPIAFGVTFLQSQISVDDLVLLVSFAKLR